MPSIYKSVKACLRANCALSEYCNCYLGLRQGCLISPILFLLFINELTTVIQESGFRGVQLYPGLVEIFLLLFADEVVLIPDAIVGLQSQLNLLKEFRIESRLVVNTLKTKVMVFKN